MIAILAVIAGAKGWDDIELYAESHQRWLEEVLELRNGIPHADTYTRVFALIDPQSWQSCFLSWIKQIAKQTQAEVIAIDGKQSTGSYDRSAYEWANENRLMLEQVKVKDKSNEITAIPALLKLLDVTDSILTLDAMGTQTEIADLIVRQRGDYVLSLFGKSPNPFKLCWSMFQSVQIFSQESNRIATQL